MKRYVVTGAPGAGKTVILRVLESRGYAVVDEAATDVIARGQAGGRDEPWRDEGFVDQVVAMQRARQEAPVGHRVRVQVYDRSPICTLALARYLGRPVSAALSGEIDRITSRQVYDRRVFFVRPIGVVEPTAARRITFEDSLVFERLHEDAYRSYGFEVVDIPPGEIAERATRIEAYVASWA